MLAIVSLAMHAPHNGDFNKPRLDTLARSVTCTLTNGDRLSGSSIEIRSDTLVLTHNQLGELSLPSTSVSSCTTSDGIARVLLLMIGKLAPPGAATRGEENLEGISILLIFAGEGKLKPQ